MYTYHANVVRVVDADTIDCDIDLGLYTWIRAGRTNSPGRLRLYGIDAWETRGPERDKGLLAKDALKMLLAGFYNQVVIHTMKDDMGKYGRFLAVVYPMDDHGEQGYMEIEGGGEPPIPQLRYSINHWLVENDHAVWKMY